MLSNLFTCFTPWEFKLVRAKLAFGRNQKFTQDLTGMTINLKVKDNVSS